MLSLFEYVKNLAAKQQDQDEVQAMLILNQAEIIAQQNQIVETQRAQDEVLAALLLQGVEV